MLKDLKNGYVKDTREVNDLGLRMWITGITIALIVVFTMYVNERRNNDTVWRERYNYRAAEVIELQVRLDRKDSLLERKLLYIDSIKKEQARAMSDVYDGLYLKMKELERLKEINETTIKKLKRNGIKN